MPRKSSAPTQKETAITKSAGAAPLAARSVRHGQCVAVAEDPAPYGTEPWAAPPTARTDQRGEGAASPSTGKLSSLLDTRVVYCGDNLDQIPRFLLCCD